MKKISLRRAAWAAVLCLALPSAAWADPADEHILKGNKFAHSKDLKKAAVEYEEALRITPDHPKAHLLLGMTYANLGDYAKAEQHLQASVKSQPSYDGFHFLGLVYANKGELAKAIDAFENAAQMNPKAFRTWYQLGQVHAASGNFKNSIDAYKKSVELNPQFWDAYLGLGVAYYWSGDKLQALEQVNQLKMVKAKDKAAQLEKWIESKEALKKEKTRPAGVPA